MERFRCGMPYRAVAAWLTVIGVAAAQIPRGVPEAAESPVEPASAGAGATAELASPQHTMRTFLDAANRAFEGKQQAHTILSSTMDGLREPIHPEIDGNPICRRASTFPTTAPPVWTFLDILVIYWFAPPLYWDYMEHAEKFNLRLFEAFESLGVEFAFPTQTVYLAGDPNRELTVKTS